MVPIECEGRRGLHRWRGWIGMREHEARHAVGERRFADAGRAADQPRMRDAAAAVGLEERTLGRGMAEPGSRVARMRRLGLVVPGAPRRVHEAMSAITRDASAG